MRWIRSLKQEQPISHLTKEMSEMGEDRFETLDKFLQRYMKIENRVTDIHK